MSGEVVRGIFFPRLVMSGQLVSLVEILTRCYFKTFGGKKTKQKKNECKFPSWASITIGCVKYVNSHLV